MIEPALPTPTYISPRDFGCQACRSAFDQLPLGSRKTPDVLMPIADHLGEKPLPWTAPFFSCRQCRSIWAMSFNPKDLINEMTPTPLGMEQALRPGATLDQMMIPLFAWAPVDEMTEHALWQTRYEPQRLMDRLLAAWGHPDIDFNRRLDVIRQMARLVSTNNPYHRTLQQQRGWLLESHRGFDEVVSELEDNLSKGAGPWACVPGYVLDNVETLRRKLAESAVIRDLPTSTGVEVSHVDLPKGTAQSSFDEPERFDVKPTVAGRFWQLITPYRNFLPAIIGGWVIERIISNLAPAAQSSGSLLLVLVLVLNGVAVMKNAGVGKRSIAYLVWHRLSAIGDYLVFVLLAAVATIAATAAASVLGLGIASLSPVWQAAFVAVCFSLLLVRLWPFWVIPFMQRVEDDIPSPRAYGITRLSALGTAWRLTATTKVFVRFTLPWLLSLALAISSVWAAGVVGGDWGRSLLLYPIILPAIYAFTWALVERITGARCFG